MQEQVPAKTAPAKPKKTKRKAREDYYARDLHADKRKEPETHSVTVEEQHVEIAADVQGKPVTAVEPAHQRKNKKERETKSEEGGNRE